MNSGVGGVLVAVHNTMLRVHHFDRRFLDPTLTNNFESCLDSLLILRSTYHSPSSVQSLSPKSSSARKPDHRDSAELLIVIVTRVFL